MSKNIPISLLELAIITQGSTTALTLQKTKALAQKAGALGYRFWLAEHHNMLMLLVRQQWFLLDTLLGKLKTYV